MEAAHRIDLSRRDVAPALRGLVAGIVGLSESSCGVVRRRQPAGSVVPLVLSFGEPLVVEALSDADGGGRAYGSFVAGLAEGCAQTRFEGGQDTVQVYLTPLGVRRILGVPGREVARRLVPADAIAAELGAPMSERLHAAPTWRERFALVEDVLLARAERQPETPAWLARLWQQIRATGGRARIADLAVGTGWSHRHVTSQFRDLTGLTPKQLAGIVRFERAARELALLPLAAVAARHGYADQSHLARDVRRYAGETPRALAAARRPTPASAMGEQTDR